MSEPQITHSAEPTADLRGTIQAVLDRHSRDVLGADEYGNLVYDESCELCYQDWPCDAHTAASALLEAVTALEKIREFRDWGEYVDDVLATITAKLNGADDA